MTDEELCGYEDTTTGDPCQHPAGSCPVPSHSGTTPDGGNPQGRPSTFNDERARQAIHAARQSKSKAGCARAAGLAHHSTIDDWLDRDPTFTDEDGEERRFSEAFARARADGETLLIQGGLRDGDVDSSMAKFMLASSYGYQKSEKREHEHAGAGGGPIEIQINETVVETGYDEEGGAADG